MDVKIPDGAGAPPGAAEAGEAAAEAGAVAGGQETAATDAVSATATGSIDRIAHDLAAGRIGAREAVDRLIEEALASGVAGRAPSEIRAEMAEALRALVETDPHLGALVAGLERR